MPLPLVPLLVFGAAGLATASALQARALRSDDLEPRLLGLPLNGAAAGGGVALAALSGGTALPVVGLGVAMGAAQSMITSSQVAHNSDPLVLADRDGPVPQWIMRTALTPLAR